MTASIYSINKAQTIAFQMGDKRVLVFRSGEQVHQEKIDGEWFESDEQLHESFIDDVRNMVKD